jgi:4-hydroxythreonine-4-phosphate dehydrogenase
MVGMAMKPIIGVLVGDATGVGPELVVRLASRRFFDDLCRPIVIGDARVFEMGMKIIGQDVPYQLISDVSEATWTQGILSHRSIKRR